jgi:hypothetical protein
MAKPVIGYQEGTLTTTKRVACSRTQRCDSPCCCRSVTPQAHNCPRCICWEAHVMPTLQTGIGIFISIHLCSTFPIAQYELRIGICGSIRSQPSEANHKPQEIITMVGGTHGKAHNVFIRGFGWNGWWTSSTKDALLLSIVHVTIHHRNMHANKRTSVPEFTQVDPSTLAV